MITFITPITCYLAIREIWEQSDTAEEIGINLDTLQLVIEDTNLTPYIKYLMKNRNISHFVIQYNDRRIIVNKIKKNKGK